MIYQKFLPFFVIIVMSFFFLTLTDCGPSVTKRDTQLARVFLNTAESNFVNGNFDAAVREASKSIERNPTNPEAYRVLALAYYGQQKIKGAIMSIKKAIDLDKNNGTYFNDLGGFYLSENRCSEALQMFEKALDDKTYQEPAAVLYNMGDAYRCLGNDNMAQLKYKESMERDPNQDRSYYRLGIYAKQQGDLEEAMRYFKECTKMNAYNIEAWKEMCLYYCNQNAGDKVQEYCTQYIQRVPKEYADQQTLNQVKRCLILSR